MIILVAIIRFLLSLHKTGCTSAIQTQFDCFRFALFLHKIGCALAKLVNFLCLRLALSLHKANGVRFGRIQFCHLHAS